MDVVTALAGDTSSHEVPECNPPVITTNSEHCTASVELGYECLASRVQYPVIVLGVARIEGSEELQVQVRVQIPVICIPSGQTSPLLPFSFRFFSFQSFGL